MRIDIARGQQREVAPIDSATFYPTHYFPLSSACPLKEKRTAGNMNICADLKDGLAGRDIVQHDSHKRTVSFF